MKIIVTDQAQGRDGNYNQQHLLPLQNPKGSSPISDMMNVEKAVNHRYIITNFQFLHNQPFGKLIQNKD